MKLLLRYFSLNQSVHIDIPRATPLAWLKNTNAKGTHSDANVTFVKEF